MTGAPNDDTAATAVALQWGLGAAFVVDTLARLVRNAYRAVLAAPTPEWVLWVRVAPVPAFAAGTLAGLWWVRWGPGELTAPAHGRRRRFLNALVVLWPLATVPTIVAGSLTNGGFSYTVPWFLIPTVSALAAGLGATCVGYSADPAWFRRRRHRLLGVVQGALVGFVLSFAIAAAAVFAPTFAPGVTQYGVAIDDAVLLAGLTGLGAALGYVLTDDARRVERAAEFFTVLSIVSVLELAVVLPLTLPTLSRWGFVLGRDWALLFPLFSVAALVLAGVPTYAFRTTLFARLVGRDRPAWEETDPTNVSAARTPGNRNERP